MRNLSTGSGLALLAGAIVVHAFLGMEQVRKQPQTPAPPPAPTVVASSGAGHGTVVAMHGHGENGHLTLYRMWSDGYTDQRGIASGVGLPLNSMTSSGYLTANTPWVILP